MPEIDLVGPIAALAIAIALAAGVRVYLVLAARRDTQRAERVLQRMLQHGAKRPDRPSA